MFRKFMDDAMLEFGSTSMHVTLEKWVTDEDGIPVLISLEFEVEGAPDPAPIEEPPVEDPAPEEPPIVEPTEDAPVLTYTVTDDKSVAYEIGSVNKSGYPIMRKVEPVVRYDRGDEAPVFGAKIRADGGTQWYKMYELPGFYLNAEKGTLS